MAKSVYRKFQETRVKVRRAKRGREEHKITSLAASRNRASMEAYRLEKINKAKSEEREAKAWLKQEEDKRQAMRNAEHHEKQQAKRQKVRRFEKGVSKHGKKAVRAFDVSMRNIFLR